MSTSARPRWKIENIVTSVLEEQGVDSPAVPVESIANALGIQVVRSAADWNQSGFLLRESGQAIIGLNSRNAPVRQRFTIAHELGHFHLHEGKKLIVDQSAVINNRNQLASSGTDAEEIEANAFAAALLMPKQMLRDAAQQELKKNPATREEFIGNLAKQFDVSTEAMSIRLSNLGVLRN
ncbi:ImmA/IrrE family metallo-endopeptidase [Nocardia takedensis]